MQTTALDPVTVEVVRNKLDGIANEMELTLLKSSCSCTPTSRGSRNNTTAPSLRAICSATTVLKERHARHPMTRKHCASHRESARW